jgi:hypothetical protein
MIARWLTEDGLEPADVNVDRCKGVDALMAAVFGNARFVTGRCDCSLRPGLSFIFAFYSYEGTRNLPLVKSLT